MAPRIKLLPNVLINKIAAGEVIERPASVVKELVENALDAEAISVEVRIEEGGLKLIEVNDNGLGMSPEDLGMAVQRHATSKIAAPEDLFNIHSFGFRGEALPSICAVSHTRIRSRPHDAEGGYELQIEGGNLREERAAGCDYGTYISVRNLFFNQPARRKFLKSPAAEVRAVLQVAEWLSLANHATAFVCESDGRRLLDLQAVNDKVERAQQLFGVEQADKFVCNERFSDSLTVEVYLSKPELCRRSRSRVLMLVNGRRIESKSLFAALMGAYSEFMPKGVYPQGAIFITIDPAQVDVNVHPAKSEVRFADERALFHVLYHVVHEALLKDRAVPGYVESRAAEARGFSSRDQRTAASRDALRDYFTGRGLDGDRTERSLGALFDHPDVMSQSPAGETARRDSQSTAIDQPSQVVSKQVFQSDGLSFQQLANLYIVVVAREALMVIDQHAAHERILFERAMRAFKEESVVGQRLLFPLTVHLEPDDLQVFNQEQGTLERLGFLCQEFGPRQIQLEAVPALLGQKNPEKFFREMLDDFKELAGSEGQRFEKRAASFACRGAIMAGDKLSGEEMRQLFHTLMAAENPYICPHGRPTIITLSKDELDLKFGRR
ncbi:MAG: DNA mismatch repair endonuclease MutL [bacterium]